MHLTILIQRAYLDIKMTTMLRSIIVITSIFITFLLIQLFVQVNSRPHDCLQGTCYDPSLKACSEVACRGSTFGSKPLVHINVENVDMLTPNTTPYNCLHRRHNCTGPGLFADLKDKTIFFKCKFNPSKNRYRAMCFPCNKKHGKCFHNDVQACIPCGDLNLKRDEVKEIISQKTSYDCYGYDAFPCSRMGFGLNEHPGDKSISVDCRNDTTDDGEWIGGCNSCSREKFSCFIEAIGQCIENCADGNRHPYDCSPYKINPDVPCKEKGKFAMPGRSTTYYECAEVGDGSGRMTPSCKPCENASHFDAWKGTCVLNETPKAMSAQGRGGRTQAVVVARKDTERPRTRMAIPRFTTVLHAYNGYGYRLRPEPDKRMITAPFMSYDCNKVSYKCLGPGVFVNPMDVSVYFECTMGNGTNEWDMKCTKCSRYTCFDVVARTCVGTCMKVSQNWFAKCRDKWTSKCESLLALG